MLRIVCRLSYSDNLNKHQQMKGKLRIFRNLFKKYYSTYIYIYIYIYILRSSSENHPYMKIVRIIKMCYFLYKKVLLFSEKRVTLNLYFFSDSYCFFSKKYHIFLKIKVTQFLCKSSTFSVKR